MRSLGKVEALGGRGAALAPLARFSSVRLQTTLSSAAWWLASILLFMGLWEAAWAFGLANPMLLPPPHIFLQDFLVQGKFFDPKVRMSDASGGTIALAVARTIAYSTLRVLSGLASRVIRPALLRIWAMIRAPGATGFASNHAPVASSRLLGAIATSLAIGTLSLCVMVTLTVLSIKATVAMPMP